MLGLPQELMEKAGGPLGLGFDLKRPLVPPMQATLVPSGTVPRGAIGLLGQAMPYAMEPELPVAETRGELVRTVLNG